MNDIVCSGLVVLLSLPVEAAGLMLVRLRCEVNEPSAGAVGVLVFVGYPSEGMVKTKQTNHPYPMD